MFDFVSVGVQDASCAKLDRLIAVAQAVESVGADRLRLADTVGIWHPLQVHETITRLRSAVRRVNIGFHAHNDLGMATANTIAAIQAGAGSVDVTVLGIGERAGNAALEEIVMALRHTLRCPTHLRSEQLMPLTKFVAHITRLPIAPNKPIVGRNAFRHESGIHVHGLLRAPHAYEPFPCANLVGKATSSWDGTPEPDRCGTPAHSGGSISHPGPLHAGCPACAASPTCDSVAFSLRGGRSL